MNSELIKSIIVDQQTIKLPEKWVPREIWQEFYAQKDNDHIVILKGLRRCGKSTLMQYARTQWPESHFYFNFDDDRLMNFSVEDFQILLEAFIELYGVEKTCYFDEIQNIPGWERFIRRLHDQGYKIFITGSNAHLFSRELGTHLTGRYVSLEIYPYSFKEYLTAFSDLTIKKIYTTEEKGSIAKLFNDYKQLGGLPDYINYKNINYLHDLYESILYRDIMVRYKINKENSLKNLVFYLASNIGKELSFNKLKDYLHLANAATVADYCYYLENSYLSFLINRYSPSLKKQSHYGKKQYFVDHALAKTVGFRFSEDAGRLLENIVFIELKRRYREVYYHRDKKECDFLIKEQHKIILAVQVTSHLDASETRDREFAGLLEAMQCYSLNEGFILTESTKSSEIVKQNGIEKKIYIMPVWEWLLIGTK